jgi:drug/metabolite transporter (DMT)-like permease
MNFIRLPHKTKAHLALLGTNIFFAINYTAIKFLVNNDYVRSFGLNLIRITVTALLLWAIFLFKPQKTLIKRKDLFRFFLCALTGIAINQLLFVKGLSLTYSVHASLLMLTTPILITVSAAWVLKEKINVYKIAGLVMGVSGALILIATRKQASNASDVLWGDILILVNAVSYTCYFILVKPLMKIYDPMVVIRMMFTIGFFLVLPFCWKEFEATAWQLFTIKEWAVLALVVIGGTFLAYIFNAYGIKVLGASVAGTYIYSQPLFATGIAVLFGESLEAYKVIAALFIFAGVYLANKTNANA